jgi:hypothetical protein
MNQKEKDERQTKACNELRNFLQSIAVLAVAAQEHEGNPDKVSDYLDLIESDLERAKKNVVILWNYEGETNG